MEKRITLKYLNVDNEARIKLGISFLEYGICDMVNKLSTNPKSAIPGWCNQSRENAGYNLGISKTSAVKLVNRMIEKGYLEKNHLGNLRTTSKWYENVVVKKVHRSGEESSPEAVKKVHPISNIDNNIDKEESKEVPTFPLNAKESAEREDMGRVNVATSNGAKMEYWRKVYNSLFDVMLGGKTHEVETIAMRLRNDDWEAIQTHLPGYVKRTCQTGSGGKQFRSTVIGYLKKRAWLNNPNPPEVDPTRIPKSNKVTQIPK